MTESKSTLIHLKKYIQDMLRGKKILLGISGGIAAYKSPELVRQLIAEGAEVRVVATKNAL